MLRLISTSLDEQQDFGVSLMDGGLGNTFAIISMRTGLGQGFQFYYELYGVE